MFETPITLTPHHTIGDALGLVHKRAHGAVVVIDADEHPVGVFTEHDAAGFDRFTQLRNVMSSDLVTLAADIDPEEAFELLTPTPVDGARDRRRRTPARRAHAKGALRSTIYRPAVDADERLLISVAVGINADPSGAPRHSPRWASTSSSSTPRTATRRRSSRSSSRCRAVARARRSSPATSSPPTARAS